MMKKFWIALVLILIFSLPAAAEPQDDADALLQDQYNASGLDQVYDALDESTRDTLARWGVDAQGILSGRGLDAGAVWQVLGELAVSCVKNPLTALASSAAALLLCALLQAMTGDEKAAMNGAMQLFVCVGLAAVLLVPAGYTLSKTASAVAGVGDFMIVFIPVYAGILMAMGRSLSASRGCSLIFAASQFLLYLARSLLLPLTSAFFALAVCEPLGDPRPLGVTAAVKKTAVWVLGAAATVFTALVGMTGVVNNAGDSVAQRTAKFLVGNMVPVVGRALADTMATVQGCLSVLKTGSGVLGLCAVLVLLLPVLVEILLWRVSLRLLQAMANLFGVSAAARLTRALGDGFDVLLAITVCALVAYGASLVMMILIGP